MLDCKTTSRPFSLYFASRRELIETSCGTKILRPTNGHGNVIQGLEKPWKGKAVGDEFEGR